MASLQGPVVFPVVHHTKQKRAYSAHVDSPLLKFKLVASGKWGLNSGRTKNVGRRPNSRKCSTIRSSFSSSSNGNGSMAGNSNENDADYVNSSVLEAVEVRSGPEGFMIMMRDGKYLRCVHNNPQGGRLPDYDNPAIVLKMEDGTGLLLPIIVYETKIGKASSIHFFIKLFEIIKFDLEMGGPHRSKMPSVLLMAAVRNVQIARPTMYHVVKDMTEKMGYAVKLVRVTKRVHEAYFAELHLVKLDNATQSLCLDLRPSDAINIAVRCKVPIQVNKSLAYSDGMKVIESPKVPAHMSSSDGLSLTELDRPSGLPCIQTKEFNLVRNMLIAAVEERYRDAALWRDKLTQLRSKRNWT